MSIRCQETKLDVFAGAVGWRFPSGSKTDRQNECNYRIGEDHLVPDLRFEILHWK